MSENKAAGNNTASISTNFRLGGDLDILRLGFGAMRITGAGIWGPPRDLEAAKRLLRQVVASGVNFIDTADSYGPAVSEELIAEALHPYPSGLVIATKGGMLRPGPGQWTPDGRPAHLKRVCEESLRRLRLGRIDLYQLHRPDPNVPLLESVGALVELQAAGKIRHIGLSNVSQEQLAQAQSIAKVVSVQNPYNLTNRGHEEVMRACAKQGLAFLPYFPLAVGNLARAGGNLQTIAARHHATPGQVALAWLLHHSPTIIPIPGTSSPAHFEENFGALRVSLTSEEMAQIAA
ncbi:MAG TPA: aldo/keto reductase [Candidatus Binataceae bacterium]|nr:aldo/keto reductase [Candidatus Binataceae bacterium]